MKLGLRIDVDTYRGTVRGVPALCDLLARFGFKASFFFSVGPDNMGRNLYRLLRPTFLKKMLRTQGARLYGWDILLRGTFWPGPRIAERLPHVLARAAADGHEMGLHAWDHYRWQTKIDDLSSEALYQDLDLGVAAMTHLGHQPVASAAPAWKCTDTALFHKHSFPFSYNSDCRGTHIFYPKIGRYVLSQPQIPVTLPTYDEVIGLNGITDANYNAYLLSLLQEDALNVLTIHAEVEGIVCLSLFEAFLEQLAARDGCIVPLGSLPPESRYIPIRSITRRTVPGREGWMAVEHEPVGI